MKAIYHRYLRDDRHRRRFGLFHSRQHLHHRVRLLRGIISLQLKASFSFFDEHCMLTYLASDWFRLETLDDSLQPTIDMLLNLSVFMYFGAVCPWPLFLNQPKPPITITSDPIIPLYRLIPLGILILMLRRLPVVYAMHGQIRQIEEKQQALFVGFFGPIGVSAVFYLYVSKEFLADITVLGSNGEETMRDDVARLSDTMEVIIWFLAICSIVLRPLHPLLGITLTQSRSFTVFRCL